MVRGEGCHPPPAEESHTQYQTIVCDLGLPSAFSFGLFDYGEVKKLILPAW